jgi:hypothetical protein
MCVLSCSIYEQIDLVEFAHQPNFCFCNVRPLLLVKIIKKNCGGERAVKKMTTTRNPVQNIRLNELVVLLMMETRKIYKWWEDVSNNHFIAMSTCMVGF